ncbi:hypothetical protein ARMSODRAFT_977012 [Armillaria solidipes]|uniref:Uncharacterized protein n=1 Tax=Armillaria solidipes TaxID=1076256 RepID=A0A2H3BEL8_9AGAR|nr:hypothetical protein ARMSODRAFT_977012 [Armillaria solidipes]
MGNYKAAQEATALTNLMNNNFRNLQECSNMMKTTVDSQNTNGEAVNKQLQELKQSIATLQAKLANQHIIVKPMADETHNKMNKQLEKDLVSEMNEALATMATSVKDTLCVMPDNIMVIGAHKIANSRVAYMFNSDNAATWLCTPGALENIQRTAGDEMAASLQLNNVIVLFALTTIDIRDNVTYDGNSIAAWKIIDAMLREYLAKQ